MFPLEWPFICILIIHPSHTQRLFLEDANLGTDGLPVFRDGLLSSLMDSQMTTASGSKSRPSSRPGSAKPKRVGWGLVKKKFRSLKTISNDNV